MEWVTNELPSETGDYIVSVNLQRSRSKYVFPYLAHYVREENKWYKYDPFDENYKPTVEVEGVVAAWARDIGVFVV